MTFLVQPSGGTLPRDGDDRRTVHVGVRDTGDQVGCSGAEGRHANARPARQPSVDVGHESGTLLMMRGDKSDWTVEQRVHDIDVLFAGNAEDVLDAFVLETFYK